MSQGGISDYEFTQHALFEMQRRGISVELATRVVEAPGQQLAVRAGRVVLQSRTTVSASPTVYLVRVIVDVDRRPAEIVTVYRTTKLAKYWRDEP